MAREAGESQSDVADRRILTEVPVPDPLVPLIDSHCHLDQPAYAPDRDAAIARARACGVGRMITVGAGGTLTSNRAAVALAEHDDDIFAAVAVHPHDASEITDDTYPELRALWAHPKVMAVGETGLDYYYNHSTPDVQRHHLRRFVREARQANLPLVIHCRDAFDDLLPILREEDAQTVGGVLHCFSGTQAEADACLALGFYLSFSGIITFKTAAALRSVVQRTPMDRLLIETDAPFLAPTPYRGKRNEPALLRQVAEQIAEATGRELEEIARVTGDNASRLFRLPS